MKYSRSGKTLTIGDTKLGLPRLWKLVHNKFPGFKDVEIQDNKVKLENFLTALFWITGRDKYRQLRDSCDKSEVLELKFLEAK